MENNTNRVADIDLQERTPPKMSGFVALFLVLALVIVAAPLAVFAAVLELLPPWVCIVPIVILFAAFGALIAGLKIVKPNEALVLTLFGKYHGTIREPGFFFVNPFVSSINPLRNENYSASYRKHNSISGDSISMKNMTLENNKQKINDLLGNPLEIGVVVIWRVVNTVKAVFNVDHFPEYLSIQCDSVLRTIVQKYPYDATTDGDGSNSEYSLRGSSEEIAARLRDEMQKKTDVAGLEIVEVRITHLAYAPEIAAAMLQRQQASAVIDARQMIVEGAVSMVEMALTMLSEQNIVQLDEERKAAMVSNLLVVLCGNKDTQPIINSGSIY